MDEKIIEAWEWYNSHPPWTECLELVKKINEMVTEYKRIKDLILMRSFFPEDEDDFDEFEYIHQECVIFTGPHEEVKKSALTAPTWVFRPGKNAEGEISGWSIGKEDSKLFLNSLEGLELIHFLLERWAEKKRPIPVKNMGKDRSTIIRNAQLAFSKITSAAAGDPALEAIVTHLEERVHLGAVCYYDPEEEINWILK